MPGVKKTPNSDRSPIYQIIVEGCLDACWSPWFDDLTVAHGSTGEGSPITTLTGPIPDQAGLRGILCKLWDLGLTVNSVTRYAEPNRKRKGLHCRKN